MPDVVEIAGRLSEAQRLSIMSATDLMSNYGGFPFFTVRRTDEPWPQGVCTFLTLKSDRLTETGLAVRAYLENSRVTD